VDVDIYIYTCTEVLKETRECVISVLLSIYKKTGVLRYYRVLRNPQVRVHSGFRRTAGKMFYVKKIVTWMHTEEMFSRLVDTWRSCVSLERRSEIYEPVFYIYISRY
jgi:hypothetical protein